MNWETIAKLIITIGLPAAEAIVQKWASGKDPTPEDFVELRALYSTTSKDQLKSVLAAKGIPLDSDRAKELLALLD